MGLLTLGSLGEGERILNSTAPNKMVDAWLILLGVLTAIIGIGLILLLIAIVKYYSRELMLTNKRIIAKSGVTDQLVVDIPLDEVESLGYAQGNLASSFNFGDIRINKKDGTSVEFKGMHNPFVFCMDVNIYLEGAAENKGEQNG